MIESSPSRFVLRNLGVAPRLVLACFLVSVGVGYFSALVQLHFQAASPGKLLPDGQDVVRVYNGGNAANGARAVSKMEQLLEAPANLPFGGSGTMRPAFTTKSSGWKGAVKDRAKKLAGGKRPKAADLAKAQKELEAERDGERQAVIAWLRNAAKKEGYDKDQFVLPSDLAGQPITAEFLVTRDDQPVSPPAVKIRSLLQERCVRCHAPDTSDKAREYPLDTYEHLLPYAEVKAGSSGGMSLVKLAQTTHVHLLGFAMLYGLTGLIFSFTSYPAAVRIVLGPLPLLAQLADISCWWLARIDPVYAQVIQLTGGLVAAGLFLHIVLSLFNMFGRTGKLVLVALLIGAAAGGYELKQQVIDPYIQQEGQQQQAVPGE